MRLFKNWALATFILTLIVILAGGIVRTTQSGMGCPDWPKCFGLWIPPTSADQLPPDFEKFLGKQDIDHSFNAFHTWIEYINRLVGVLLGLFAVIQFIIAFRQRKNERKAFKWSVIYLALVIATGLFGAVVVKFNLAHATITIHLLFALLLLLASLFVLMHLYRKREIIPSKAQEKKLFVALLIVIGIQMILGTSVRIYVDDISASFNYTQREQWLAALPVIFIIHRSFSWLVLLLGTVVFFRNRNNKLLKVPNMLLYANLLLSVTTGIVLYYLDMPAVAQPVHLLLACAAVCQVVFVIFSLRPEPVSEQTF